VSALARLTVEDRLTLGDVAGELIRAADSRTFAIEVGLVACDLADAALDRIPDLTAESRAKIATLRRILKRLSP
jgi:hypothetical protein